MSTNDLPAVMLGPESGRVIADIVASRKLAEDIAQAQPDLDGAAWDLLREAREWVIDGGLERRIRALLAEKGKL